MAPVGAPCWPYFEPIKVEVMVNVVAFEYEFTDIEMVFGIQAQRTYMSNGP
jgi:hypothetical protein